MNQSRNAPAKIRPVSIAAKAIQAVVEGANRVLEALGPQPQLQPIPVRVRRGRGDGRR